MATRGARVRLRRTRYSSSSCAIFMSQLAAMSFMGCSRCAHCDSSPSSADAMVALSTLGAVAGMQSHGLELVFHGVRGAKSTAASSSSAVEDLKPTWQTPLQKRTGACCCANCLAVQKPRSCAQRLFAKRGQTGSHRRPRTSRSVQQVPHSWASSRAHRDGGLSPLPIGMVRGAREERLGVRLPV